MYHRSVSVDQEAFNGIMEEAEGMDVVDESGSSYQQSSDEEGRSISDRQQTYADRNLALNTTTKEHIIRRTGEESSPLSHGAIQRRPKKRSGEDTHHGSKRTKKGLYSDAYRLLLNDQVYEAAERSDKYAPVVLPGSQIGSSQWTSGEKQRCFEALSRLGRDNALRIAKHIGTKSEIEVREYLYILQAELVKRRKHGRSRKLLRTVDFPAATEIGQESCEILDKFAQGLATRQENYEEKLEHAKWGGWWLLTSAVNQSLKTMKDEEVSANDFHLPAGDLLNLGNWLELSEVIFMNPSEPCYSDNWHNIAGVAEAPAIRATAFEDFHSLAVSITKRLVAATLFNTMARLKATKAQKVKHAEVNADDVYTAVKILGLPSNSDVFWIDCARRCHLEVLDDERWMTHAEVEKVMGEPYVPRSRSCSGNWGRRRFGRVGDETAEHDSLPASEHDETGTDIYDESEHSSSSHTDENSYINLAGGQFTRITSRTKNVIKKESQRQAMELAQEEYIDLYDTQQSRQDERSILAMLGQPLTLELQNEELDLPPRPKDFVDESHDIDDWRDYLKHQSEWVTFESPVPVMAFLENRKVSSVSTRSVARGAQDVLNFQIQSSVRNR